MSGLTLEKFECDGEAGSVGARWERWKRGLYIYLEAADVISSSKKRASLLHWGGQELQEILFNIPGGYVALTEDDGHDIDVFEVSIKKLDEYFAPKQNKRYERHLFRQMKQEENEKFEKYLVRLRQQALKCQFTDVDDCLIDQIIEKCSSEELRKKVLRAGEKITLTEVITEANTLEVVERQLGDFSQKGKDQAVNRIDTQLKEKTYINRSKKECYRCGSWNHLAYDAKCPAKGKLCNKCKKVGHFQAQCKSASLKRRSEDGKAENGVNAKKFKKSSQKVGDIKQTNAIEDKIDYVFNVLHNDTLTCLVGGIEIEMLIDSGCQHNLITDTTWLKIKEKILMTGEEVKNPGKTFVAYGSEIPLKLLTSFNADIRVRSTTKNATFYVIDKGTRNLLGKTTAIALGVLKLGLDINQVETKPFPKFKNIQIQIPINSNVNPVAQPYRRIPIPLEEKINSKIDELLQRDIIEKVEGPSEWVSPVVPILKADGDVRLCIDMRRANLAIKRENHPLPTMDQLLPKIQNAQMFSKLDIKDAFHQLELVTDSRHITTFISGKGLYRFKRLMFGITCAPEMFQKTLERVLIECEGVVNFIDDILVYGKDKQEHDKRLKKVLETLKSNDVMLRQDKCIYGTTKVQFLGHELSDQGIRPLDKYLLAIKDFRTPINISELQSFLGLINYIGKWIPNMATLTEPLKQLLRKKSARNADIKDSWGESQQTAFCALKAALCDIPNLGYYNVNDKTMVFADASPVGLGAILVQANGSGPRIIGFGNKTLSDCERRYCQTEKEALALVWAVEHFHMFLYGKEFDLITDHKPLEVIFGPKSKPCARIERWILRLQSYKYNVVYRPGKNNIADPLSRLCTFSHDKGQYRDYVQDIIDYARPIAVSLKDIEEHSRIDDNIQKVKQGIFNKKWDDAVKSYKLFQNELCFFGDILLRGTKIVIPIQLRRLVLDAAHEGHPGIVAMKLRLRAKVWWPNYDKDVENLVRSCKGCTLVSAPNPPHPLKRRELPTQSWVDIAIDLLGPLPSGDYLFVVIDYYSRYKEIKACRDISSQEMIRLLKDIFSRLGHPVSITSDNGKQFVSADFRAYCRENDIKLFNSIPYWPQQNGEVERQNRDIIKRLKICQVEKKCWKEALIEYLTMYNSTPHSVTGKTPAELFFQRKFRDKIPMIDIAEQSFGDEDMRDKDKERKEKGREYTDKKRRARNIDIEVGDKVYVKNANKTNKLSPNFDSTKHTVKSKKGGDVEVQNDKTGQQLRRNIVHLKKVEGEWKSVNKAIDRNSLEKTVEDSSEEEIDNQDQEDHE
ncbi:uncharacterized protein K02A2.6-like [Zerene cesonia]|uniref:uncharacterized protein K02A2.6-like n=1 Tax=Zerene cesonia TaxID=33412 RepID=UPI0018E55A23|nr:uncharacterized protein K02A2.6-like [Zerene cesonia]